MDIPTFTLDDFLDTTECKPYRFIENLKSDFERNLAIDSLTRQAKSYDKSFNFKSHLEDYFRSKGQSLEDHFSEFSGQPFQLKLGTRWIADDSGVRKLGNGQTYEACSHAIMPVSRLVNVDSGDCLTEIGYRCDDEPWRTAIFDRETLASNNKILKLAAKDISVTGSTAKYLCDYIDTALRKNRDIIPVKKSIGRMGWVGTSAFSPYMDNLVPDNEDQQRNFWNAVKPHGNEENYIDTIKTIRQSEQVIPRIALAASLASVLVKPCGGLPFVIHIWGKTSTGKTVTLMLASSVWGNPDVGQYTRSFNATAVGLELSAAFLNNLPLVLDELQTISRRKDFEDIIYELTEGTNRSRGQKDGGLQAMKQWSNSVITSGEMPITSSSSGGGMVGRIIELDCTKKKLYPDGHKVAEELKKNYGFLGKRFVELLLSEDLLGSVREYREKVYDDIISIKSDVAEKQAFSASLILTADHFLTDYILQDGRALTAQDLSPFLASMDDADQNRRAYEWLDGWIASNTMHFFNTSTDWNEVKTSVYGIELIDSSVAIIKTVFNEACQEAGYNPVAFARWLKENNISKCDSDRSSRTDKIVTINGKGRRCIVIDNSLQEVTESESVPW